MAVVQALAHAAAFRFVLRHHVGLEHHAAGDGLGDGIGLTVDHGRYLIGKPEEELVAVDERGFRHLAATACPLARRQRCQHLGVGAHERRLLERAHQVLSGG